MLFRSKILVVGRGSQKMNSKLKSLQQPLTEADFQVFLPTHGIHARLIGGQLVSSHPLLRKNVKAFGYACKCSEMVDVLVPFRVGTPEVYDILQHAFRSLCLNPIPELEWIQFVVRLLKALGDGDIKRDIQVLMPSPSALNINRALALVDSHLERVLPWRLKSEVLV